VYSSELPGELLTLDEAAAVLRVSKKTLRRRIDGGELDVVRDRRLVLVPRATLLAFIARHTVRRPADWPSSMRSKPPGSGNHPRRSVRKLWDAASGAGP
jgi:excisionase family DNA binding protein